VLPGKNRSQVLEQPLQEMRGLFAFRAGGYCILKYFIASLALFL